MAPGCATEEKEFLAFGNRIIGLANDLTKKGIACKLSVAYGNFTFNMDTTRLAKSPRRRRKKCPSVLERDKRRRIEFLKRKEPNSRQSAPPTDCLSGAAEGGVAGAELKETNEVDEVQREITLMYLSKKLDEMLRDGRREAEARNIRLQTSAEEDEVNRSSVREWLQKNERTGQLREVTEVLDATTSGGSEGDLLDLTGRLGTMMKCFQREVKSTDEKVSKAKKMSSVSRSPRRKKRRRKK